MTEPGTRGSLSVAEAGGIRLSTTPPRGRGPRAIPELPETLGLAVDRATNRLTGKLHDVAGNLLESTAAGARVSGSVTDT